MSLSFFGYPPLMSEESPFPSASSRQLTEEATPEIGDFSSAFLNSLGMIFATEIGDKTFFIAAILAMRHSRLIVFSGAIGALTVMTVLSTVIGHALPHLLPKVLTHWASIILFVYFGAKMLMDAKHMYATGEGAGVSEELEEVEYELINKGLAVKLGTPSSQETEMKNAGEFGLDDLKGVENISTAAESSGPDVVVDLNEDISGEEKSNAQATRTTPIGLFMQAFMLTFLAEWGDRSQIATIALAAAQNPFGVTLGAVIGHSFCTGGAVIGGKMLASRITERQVALCGGVLFFVFAFYSWWMGPQ